MILKNSIKKYLIEEGKITVYIKKNGKIDFTKPIYDTRNKKSYIKDVESLKDFSSTDSGISIVKKMKSLSSVPTEGYYDIDYNMINNITTLRPSENY